MKVKVIRGTRCGDIIDVTDTANFYGNHTVIDDPRYEISSDDFKIIKEEPMNTFKKSDLKTGMMVQLMNDRWHVIMKDYVNQKNTYKMIAMDGEGYVFLDEHNEDLQDNEFENYTVKTVATADHINEIMESFVNHSDPTAIPGFHIIWSRESDEKAKVVNVIEGLQKELNDAKRKLEELG